ncbi:RraA family protein [Hominifimenecus sp. rT4P-3]|uniref:RraA family protein n=1 Tax=Hominifimenecus sp. rT4P-3 TaxID=3242979 RepID=UPI003DA5BE3C
MYKEEEKRRIVEQYETFPTGNIADAMSYLGIPSGVVIGLHPNDPAQKRSAGFALTIQQRIKGKNVQETGKTKQRLVINTMTQAYDMVVIDACGCMNVSTGGGLLALRAKIRGVRGFLVNGCLRDVEEIAKLPFPVYLKGAVPAASGQGLETIAINEAVCIGGILIQPGDLVVMDVTGCIVIPQRWIERIADTVSIVMKQEARAEELLRQGMDFEEARRIGIEENPWPKRD